jgi:hypothetical protein
LAAEATEHVDRVKRDLAHGELLAAHDHARAALDATPDHLELQFLAVLALARAGATRHALERYAAWRLADRARRAPSAELRTDLVSLGARLAKDRALRAPRPERGRALRDAAAAYERVFRAGGDSFPGVNAATLWLLAGDAARARRLSHAVDRACERSAARTGLAEYYRHATLAESALVRDDTVAAAHHLAAAAAVRPADHGAIAATRRQLRLLCGAVGCDASVLEALPTPGVVHFCGHRPGRRFAQGLETVVHERIRAVLDRAGATSGYGALASGADILFAEALLQRDAELHVVLPFDVGEFVRVSVRPSGDAWVRRFEACLARASSVTFATHDRHHGDDEVFAYGTRIAMGLATIRARFLEATPLQVAAWDGDVEGKPSQTFRDMLAWAATGRPSLVVATREADVPERLRIRRAPARAAARPTARRLGGPGLGRVTRAMLFGDFQGFSKLDDGQTRAFVTHLMGRLGRTIDRHASHVRFKNTWGDGIYVVLDDVVAAGALALDLQASLAGVDRARLGLPGDLALRIGGHAGPVFEAVDPVLKRRSYFGSHVSRTARIEPVALPGAVYVSDLFAATLALEPPSGLEVEYVGRVQGAKGYGAMGMYRLEGGAPRSRARG